MMGRRHTVHLFCCHHLLWTEHLLCVDSFPSLQTDSAVTEQNQCTPSPSQDVQMRTVAAFHPAEALSLCFLRLFKAACTIKACRYVGRPKCLELLFSCGQHGASL
jgi:hypothetical protein